MPNTDKCQALIIRLLQISGWQILILSKRYVFHTRRIYLDIVAARGAATIYLEVKCFDDDNSLTTEQYTALGQYLFYRETLAALNDSTPLYLTVPRRVYDKLDNVALALYRTHKVKLLVYDEEEQEALEWIETP